MSTQDIKDQAKALAPVINGIFAPFLERVAALERKIDALPTPQNGRDGKDADMDAIKAHISGQIAAAIKAIPHPENGKDGAPGRDGKDGVDVDMEAVDKLILERIVKAVESIPKPQDGRDGAPGKDGKDADTAAITEQIKTMVAEAVKAIPVPQDGKDGKDGRDGVDGKSFTLDDAARLLEERMATWALDFERRAQTHLEKAIDRMPAPKDGKDGAPGKDGVGFDDMHAEYDGDRAVLLKFRRGDVVKTLEMRIPIVIYRGTYQEGVAYEPGDGVTWGGSFWIAQKASPGKPKEDKESGWKLSVKKGRDGRDGRDGIDKTAPVKLGGVNDDAGNA